MATKDRAEQDIEAWNAGLFALPTVSEAARRMGVAPSTLRDRLARAKKAGLKVAAHKPDAKMATVVDVPAPVGRSLTDFRVEHDKSYIVPKRVTAAIEKLGDGWLYEVEFAKLAGVSLSDLGHFRSAFEDHIVAIRRDGGKRAWAKKHIAAKMREMVS